VVASDTRRTLPSLCWSVRLLVGMPMTQRKLSAPPLECWRVFALPVPVPVRMMQLFLLMKVVVPAPAVVQMPMPMPMPMPTLCTAALMPLLMRMQMKAPRWDFAQTCRGCRHLRKAGRYA